MSSNQHVTLGGMVRAAVVALVLVGFGSGAGSVSADGQWPTTGGATDTSDTTDTTTCGQWPTTGGRTLAPATDEPSLFEQIWSAMASYFGLQP